MFVKQYEITLPADYDMGIIRHRVATSGPSFDTFPGLGLKSFLIREKGRHGAEANQYAPVYLWPHEDRMWGFVAGAAFAKIKADFGVPPVATWPGLAFARGARLDDLGLIASVTRETSRLDATVDLQALHACERDEAEAAVTRDDTLLAHAVGLDVRTWSLVRFGFWARAQGDHLPDACSYEVLHSSGPALAALG